jgi:hypothetical protein
LNFIDKLAYTMEGGKESEQGGLPARRGEDTPLASLMHEHENSNGPTHQEMVAAIRRGMAQKRADMERGCYKYNPDWVEWLGDQLSWQGITKGGLEYAESAPRSPITNKPEFPKLLMAWDAISHRFLKHEHARWRIESVIESRVKYFEPIITLKPKEAKLLDAMAEAAGIPRTHGETEINLREYLPEHLARHIGQRLPKDSLENN